MTTQSKIDKKFDERYHSVLRAWKDSGFVLDLGKDIKRFYAKEILSLIKEIRGRLPKYDKYDAEKDLDKWYGYDEAISEVRATLDKIKSSIKK